MHIFCREQKSLQILSVLDNVSPVCLKLMFLVMYSRKYILSSNASCQSALLSPDVNEKLDRINYT